MKMFLKITATVFILFLLSLSFVYAQPSNSGEEPNLEFEAIPASVKNNFFHKKMAAHVLVDPGYRIWGMTVIKWRDGKYHGYYARWPEKLGHNAWLTDCEIVHAVSDKPEGPFVFQKNPVYAEKQTEDAGIWYDRKAERFYMTCHVMGRPDLALFSSPDGYRWTIHNRLFSKKEIKLDDGKVWKPTRLERPFILTDETEKLVCLYVAVSDRDVNGNIAIPIK